MTATINPSTSGIAGSDEISTATLTAQTMTNGKAIFTTSGDILLFALASECYTLNDATASTVQYSVTSPNGTGTISGASPSLANAAVGQTLLLQPGAIANAPVLTAAAGVGADPWGAIRVPGGSTITLIVGVGSTTGTWKHYARFRPFEAGAQMTPSF